MLLAGLLLQLSFILRFSLTVLLLLCCVLVLLAVHVDGSGEKRRGEFVNKVCYIVTQTIFVQARNPIYISYIYNNLYVATCKEEGRYMGEQLQREWVLHRLNQQYQGMDDWMYYLICYHTRLGYVL